jgi:hypothetical protein
MTVNELIEHLKCIAPERRDLEVRLWLPGSQFTIDGAPRIALPTHLNKLPVVIVEGNMVPGSALQADSDVEFFR